MGVRIFKQFVGIKEMSDRKYRQKGSDRISADTRSTLIRDAGTQTVAYSGSLSKRRIY